MFCGLFMLVFVFPVILFCFADLLVACIIVLFVCLRFGLVIICVLL